LLAVLRTQELHALTPRSSPRDRHSRVRVLFPITAQNRPVMNAPVDLSLPIAFTNTNGCELAIGQ
jgi:hypothetical protein